MTTYTAARSPRSVTGCVQEKKTWLVTLDQTAFYPEGGGQPPTGAP